MTRRVELYVRSLLPGQSRERQNEIIDRLQDLEAEGVVDEFTVLVWGKHAPATPADARTDAGLFALNRVAVFTEWAEQNGLGVETHFDRRRTDSSITAESYDALTFPVMTLAEYHDDDLTFVAPATGTDHQFSVGDRVDTLAAGQTDRPSGVGEGDASLDELEHSYVEPPEELTLAPRGEAEDA